MYRIFYAERDTTLYEKKPEQNSGLDQILELTKIPSSSRLNDVVQPNTYNSRILIDFGTEITTLTNEIAAGNIPAIGSNPTSASVYLNLHASDASDILRSYSIEAYPISESWENGNGTVNDTPITKIGASWLYKSGDAVALGGVRWATSSAASQGTSRGALEPMGGGTWHTASGYYAVQAFENQSPDLKIDVSNIVNNWVSGSPKQVTNNGFIIKRPYADEISGETLGSLKFFGRESHTIYVPKLEVCWDDSSVGIFTANGITSDTYIPYIKNIKSEYRRSEIANFRVGVRPEFPIKTYQTSSFYMTHDQLPLSSSYSIIDSVTNETIIPFTETDNNFSNSKTKISYDAVGSFFKLRMDNFMPERYYKIMLKCERTADVQTFDNFYFKVVN
tara:strand:+ start:132 stop:1304 length:1173 start_codon:yes stop_codon:yes gene_type:complete